MRKLHSKAMIVASLALALAACSASPDDRAENFFLAVSSNETAKALEYIDPSLTQTFGSKMSLSIANTYQKTKAMGGLSSLETSSEIEGDRAKVNVIATFGDGTIDKGIVKLRKIDGEWYITM